jgi:hypothetical protein
MGKACGIDKTKVSKKSYSHMKDIMIAHGISSKQFRDRLRCGWNEWSAATTPLRDIDGLRKQTFRMMELNQKYSREIIEIAYKNGIKYDTFRQRIKERG